VQLEAEQLPQDDPAEVPVVCPPAPLLTNPQADIRRLKLRLWQSGQPSGLHEPMTRYSKSV